MQERKEGGREEPREGEGCSNAVKEKRDSGEGGRGKREEERGTKGR